MEIRPIQPSESSFLKEVLYWALYTPPGREPFPLSILEENPLAHYYRDWGNSSGDIALLAIRDETKLGAIWTRYFPKSDPGYGFVDEDTPELTMAVRPHYENQGIGTRLLKEMLAFHQTQGTKQISLSVDPQNRALGLYKRWGFYKVGEVGSSITMIKMLSV